MLLRTSARRNETFGGSVALVQDRAGRWGSRDEVSSFPSASVIQPSAFVGFRFPPEDLVLAVRWYLRFSLFYRDVEELLGERRIEVDRVTIYR